MSIMEKISIRANHQCELCGQKENLQLLKLENTKLAEVDDHVLICSGCHEQIENPDNSKDYFRMLSTPMWSEVLAVQVLCYRLLDKLTDYPWASDLKEQMYFEDETLSWVKEKVQTESNQKKTLDSNGAELVEGDNVTLI